MNTSRLLSSTFIASIVTFVLFATAGILYLVLAVLELNVQASVMAGLMLFLAVCWGINLTLIVHALVWRELNSNKVSQRDDENEL